MPKNITVSLIILCILLLCSLFLIPGSRLSPKCHWKSEHNLECPTCGLTRSIKSLRNGDVSQSIAYHPAGIILVSILFFELVLRLSQLYSLNISYTTDIILHSILFIILFAALNFAKAPVKNAELDSVTNTLRHIVCHAN